MATTPVASGNISDLVAPASEGLSDDSGVDTTPQISIPTTVGEPTFRRNKRKSTEPRRRKEVLQMKRFRWNSDGSDSEEPFTERPSSGDSGCQLGSGETWSNDRKRGSPRQTMIRRSADDDSSLDSELSARQRLLPAIDGFSRPRNYKSMSRQRRIEANARERTRVHTISAAFESLRRAVPAYAHNQKLSKLGILRIASAYILSLACLNNLDYSREQRRPTFEECVDICTRTIQSEGRARRRAKVKNVAAPGECRPIIIELGPWIGQILNP